MIKSTCYFSSSYPLGTRDFVFSVTIQQLLLSLIVNTNLNIKKCYISETNLAAPFITNKRIAAITCQEEMKGGKTQFI